MITPYNSIYFIGLSHPIIRSLSQWQVIPPGRQVEPPLGPVTGQMKVTIYGVGFQSTNGMAPGLVNRPGEALKHHGLLTKNIDVPRKFC